MSTNLTEVESYYKIILGTNCTLIESRSSFYIFGRSDRGRLSEKDSFKE